MLSVLGHALFRERRRLTFVTLFAFLAGALFYARSDMSVAGLPVPLVTGTIYAAIIGPVAFAVCLFLPGFRFMLEAIAISRLGVASLAFTWPPLGVTILSSPLLNACIVVGFGVAVSRLMHGRVMRDRLPGFAARLRRFHPGETAVVRVTGRDWQRRFVGWIDGAVPEAA